MGALDGIPASTPRRVVISGRPVPDKTIRRARKHINQKNSRTLRHGLAGRLQHNTALRIDREVAWVEVKKPDGGWVTYRNNTGPTVSTHSQISEGPSLDHPSEHSNQLGNHATSTPFNFLPDRPTLPILHGDVEPQFQWDDDIDLYQINTQEYPIVEHSNIWSIASFNSSSHRSAYTMSSHSVPSQDALVFLHPCLIEIRNDLPSARLLSSWDFLPAKPTHPNACFIHCNIIDVLARSLLSQTESIQSFEISAAGANSTLQKLSTVMPSRGLLATHNGGLDILSTDGTLLHTLRCILYSVMNGFIGEENVLGCIVVLHTHLANIKYPFSRILEGFSGHATKAFIENTFRSAVKSEENQLLAILLDTTYVDVNSIEFKWKGYYYTPIPYSLLLHNFEGVKILFNAATISGDCYPLSSPPGTRRPMFSGKKNIGEQLLSYLFKIDSDQISTAKRLKWQDLVTNLLDMGYTINPADIGEIDWNFDDSADICFRIASSFSPCDHEAAFANGCFYMLVRVLSDDQATAILERMASECYRVHQFSCFRDVQANLLDGLLMAAEKGHLRFFRSLLPHYTSTLEQILCEAIIGNNNKLIDYILLHYPNINTLVQLEGRHRKSKRALCIALPPEKTSPFAQAIKAQNINLIQRFEQAGIFDSLVDYERAKLAYSAADKVGDFSYIQKLVDHTPPQAQIYLSLPRFLSEVVQQNDEASVQVLLEAGASCAIEPSFNSSNNLLITALDHQNTPMVYALLNMVSNDDECERVIKAAFQWGEKSIMDDILSTFAFSYVLPDHGRKPWHPLKWGLPDVDEFRLAKALIVPLKNERIFEYFLESRLSTQRLLTECLAVALDGGDSSMVQRLIDSGADVSDHVVWAASKRSLSMMSVLATHFTSRNSTVITKGTGTNLLIQVIESGLNAVSLVQSLITSGSVDIFSNGGGHKTPLGTALDAWRSCPDITMVTVLLDAGCSPNGIVSWGKDAPFVNETALLKAVELDALPLVKLLIDRGAQINEPARLRVRQTPLQTAAMRGNLEMVEFLLSRGAHVNGDPAFSCGGTALQFAALDGNCNIAAKLLSCGAQLHAPPSRFQGRWPLEGAVEHGRLDMIEFLWRANGSIVRNPGFEEQHFQSAMELAIRNGHSACKDLLVELSGQEFVITKKKKLPPRPMYVDV